MCGFLVRLAHCLIFIIDFYQLFAGWNAWWSSLSHIIPIIQRVRDRKKYESTQFLRSYHGTAWEILFQGKIRKKNVLWLFLNFTLRNLKRILFQRPRSSRTNRLLYASLYIAISSKKASTYQISNTFRLRILVPNFRRPFLTRCILHTHKEIFIYKIFLKA